MLYLNFSVAVHFFHVLVLLGSHVFVKQNTLSLIFHKSAFSTLNLPKTCILFTDERKSLDFQRRDAFILFHFWLCPVACRSSRVPQQWPEPEQWQLGMPPETKEPFYLFIYLFIYILFRAAPEAHGSFQARGLIGVRAASLRLGSAGQATSVTYTTAHGNTRSVTHWARPGVEPVSSWILVVLISTVPQWELPKGPF